MSDESTMFTPPVSIKYIKSPFIYKKVNIKKLLFFDFLF